MTSSERQVFGLPLQYGGLGIINPVAIANHCFDSSVHSTTFLCQSILGTATFELDEHVFFTRSAKQLDAQIQANYYTTLFNNLTGRFDPGQQRAILRTKALPGFLLCHWKVISLIWLVRSFVMHLP